MRYKKKKVLPLLVFLLLGLSLGYALLTQDLTINGITKVKGNTWDIHFDNVQINSNSVPLSTGDSAATIDSNDDTLVNYTITLSKPGDYYEFTVDAVNAGTVDGMIGEVINKLNGTVISSTNPLPVYLDYTFSYADGAVVASNHLLEAGHTETYKIRVEFKRDIENDELPTADQTNSFSFGIDYLQENGSAIPVPHPTITVYTANMNSNGSVSIGSAIPNNITQYETAAEARSTLTLNSSGTTAPFAPKHEMINNIVIASYIEFVVTSEMVTANPGMTEGTYVLQGAGITRVYDEINDYYYFEDIPYENNKTVLQTAFGTSNCNNNTTQYSCTVPGLYVFISSNGIARASNSKVYCTIFQDGGSKCEFNS